MSLKLRLVPLLMLVLVCITWESYAAPQWQRVYLATYPRSGNHWLRHLIEEATHIATSSVICDKDPQHMNKCFPWGGFCVENGYNGNCRYPTIEDTVVIKTHYPALYRRPYDCRSHTKAICIVRHPVDCIYSFYLYTVKKKIPAKNMPEQKLKSMVAALKRFHSYWKKSSKVMTLKYEDFLEQPKENLAKVLKAIPYKFEEADLVRAVTLNPPQGKPLKHLQNFTQEDLEYIATELKDYMNDFGYTIPGID